jgi:methyl-accepting chemotaxis protein
VNIISFALLFSLCAAMVIMAQNAIESAMRSKADGFATFLQSMGQTYVSNYDLASLANFEKVVSTDSDFAFVAYLDNEGKPLTETSQITERPDLTMVVKNVYDLKRNKVGKVVVGYKHDRINEAFWSTVKLGVLSLVLTQLLLSLAVFLVSRGIVGPLLASLNRLSKTTRVLSNTSSNMSKFSDALSHGVSQQAEVVQETTAAMAEMSSMLAQTSVYAQQSEKVVGTVNQKTTEGMAVMYQMSEAMTSVHHSNEQLQRIVDIIQEINAKTNVINEIVFKTQVLAFNASIEASRAGRHGAGFAVVADEVGNLAKMSGMAAEEIGTLLQDSEKQVNDIVFNNTERVAIGRSVTEKALRGFNDIAKDINNISDQIANITLATREQELGVAQTNMAMNELNTTADVNSRVANSASSTSGVLSSEVQALNDISVSIENSITGNTSLPRAVVVEAAPLRKRGMSSRVSDNKKSSYSNTASPSIFEFAQLTSKIVRLAKQAPRKKLSSGGTKSSRKSN